MPAASAAAADRLPQRIRCRRTRAPSRLAVQVMKFRHRGVARFQHLDEQLRREQLESAGVMRLASAYMAWRQVQKLSRAESRYSVLPAMPRWKAWL